MKCPFKSIIVAEHIKTYVMGAKDRASKQAYHEKNHDNKKSLRNLECRGSIYKTLDGSGVH